MNEEPKDIQSLASEILSLATERGLSKRELARKYKSTIGSTGTFDAMLSGKTGGYDLDTWTERYTAALATMKAESANAENPVCESLANIGAVHRAVMEVLGRKGNDRVVLIKGDSGAGKTTALDYVIARTAGRVVKVEASDVWGDSPNALLGAILRALGRPSDGVPAFSVARLTEIQNLLNSQPRCIAIDEAHHLGPHCLNTLKTIINTTPAEIVICAIGTLWARLSSYAYSEARQLTTNRLLRVVTLAPSVSDIVKYITWRRPDTDTKVAGAIAARILSAAESAEGGMAYIRDCVSNLPPENTTTDDDTAAIAAANAKRGIKTK